MTVEFVVTDITILNGEIFNSRRLFFDLDAQLQPIALLPMLGKTNQDRAEAKFQITEDQSNTGQPLHLKFEDRGQFTMRVSLHTVGNAALAEVENILAQLQRFETLTSDPDPANDLGLPPVRDLRSRVADLDGTGLMNGDPEVGKQCIVNFTLGTTRFQIVFPEVIA